MPMFRLLLISIIGIAIPSEAIPWKSRSNYPRYCQPCPCRETQRTANIEEAQNPLRAIPSKISENLVDITKDRIWSSQNSNGRITDSPKISKKPYVRITTTIKASQGINQATTIPAKTPQNSHKETTDQTKTSGNPRIGSLYPETIYGNPNDPTSDPVKTTRNSNQRTTYQAKLSKKLYQGTNTDPTIETTADSTIGTTIDSAIETTADSTIGKTIDSRIETFTDPTIETTANPIIETTPDPTIGTTFDSTIETTGDSTIETTADPTIGTTFNSTIGTTADPTIRTTIDSTIDTTVGPTIETTAYLAIGTTIDSTIKTTADPSVGTVIDSTTETTADTTKTCENPKQKLTDANTTHASHFKVPTYLAATTQNPNQGTTDISEKPDKKTTSRVKTTQNSNHGITDPTRKPYNLTQRTTFLGMTTRNSTDLLKMYENPNTTTKGPKKIAHSLQQGSERNNPPDAVAFSGTRNVNQYFFKPGPVIFNNIITNIGGGYDYRYGVFTAYQPGIYLVKYHVAIHWNNTKKTAVDLRKNKQVVSTFSGSGFSSGLSNTILLFLKRRDMLFVQGRALSKISCGEVGDALCSFNVVLLKRGVFSDPRNSRPVPGW